MGRRVLPFSKASTRGCLSSWRVSFPKVRAANTWSSRTLSGADVVRLEGIRMLKMSGSSQIAITDAVFFAHMAATRQH